MDAALPALVEFLAEEGRSPGHGRICRGNPAEPGAQAARGVSQDGEADDEVDAAFASAVPGVACQFAGPCRQRAPASRAGGGGQEAEGRGEYVDVTFTPGSRGPLAEFTRARVGKRVEFRVDDQVLTVVTVQGAIETSGLRLSAGGSGFGGKSAADIERILEPGTYVEVADAGKAESDRVLNLDAGTPVDAGAPGEQARKRPSRPQPE